jgi:hypothetical protein
MEKLIKLVKKENKKRLEKAINDLKQTHGDDLINLWYYKEKLTNTQIKKYINKEMTEKEIKEKIKNKIIKEYEKTENKKLNKIETIKNADDDISTINITVNWTKNKTWGYNPRATIFTNKEDVTEGKASGCGYDKESTAIAEALNKNPDILKLLYIAKNKKMTFKNHNNHDILGYGSGYYELPYFEGGVGVNSLMNIFRKLGYNITEHHTDSSDFYTIIKKGVK